MKICVVHNEYSKFSGEEVMVNKIIQLLVDHGHTVTCFTRTSADIAKMRFSALRAFFSGIYFPAALRHMKAYGYFFQL